MQLSQHYLIVGLVTKQCVNQKVSYIFSVYGATHVHIFCQHPPPCCRLSLQASWSDDGELHVPSYALHKMAAILACAECITDFPLARLLFTRRVRVLVNSYNVAAILDSTILAR